MFSKITILATVSLALSAVATPHGGEYNCNTGSAQCCDSVHETNTVAGATLLQKVGVVAQGLTGSVGENCSPITAVGLGNGASCNQQPVCCENNSFNGVVAIGCTPINTSL